MKGIKTVIVLSGGLDSTTLAYKLHMEKALTEELYGISFNYGQKHSKELECAGRTAKKLGFMDHKVIDLRCLTPLISASALTSDQPVPEGHYADENMRQTVVPNRNAIMLAIAFGWAVNIGAERVAIGVHSGDHPIYSDCRPTFISSFQAMEWQATETSILLYTPFLYLTKAQIVDIAVENGVDFLDTWSCYRGGEVACGTCGTCMERLEAFNIVGVEDPLTYIDRHSWQTFTK